MLALQVLALLSATFLTAVTDAATFLLPRTVWCRMEPSGGFTAIGTRPDGPAVPHGATMVVADGRGETPLAYYYPVPTPLLTTANRLGFDLGTADLFATGREATTATGRWREFRRVSAAEFNAALARGR